MKVEFSYDNGDREAGISPGWDECLVLIGVAELGPTFKIVIGFEPESAPKVQDWRANYLGYMSDGHVYATSVSETWTLLRFGTEIVNAVEAQWRAISAQNKLESAGEDVWGGQMHRDHLIEEGADDERIAAVEDDIADAEKEFKRVQKETREILDVAEEMNEGSGPWS